MRKKKNPPLPQEVPHEETSLTPPKENSQANEKSWCESQEGTKNFQEVASTIESLANACGHETWKEYKERIQQIKDNPVSDQDCLKNCNSSLLNQPVECNQEENQTIKVAQYVSFSFERFLSNLFLFYRKTIQQKKTTEK